jgi:galactoside O-acetyltransferase
MAFLTGEELKGLGLASYGKNVLISNKASIYNPGRITIGSNVRIDDFCVLSAGDGGIDIGDYIHVAVFCSLIGTGKITLSDFSGLSSRVAIYSSNDDYSGEHLTNPTVPSDFTGVNHADVFIGRHAIIGSGTVVLPGVTLEEGVAVAALSLVSKDCAAFGVYAGNRRIGERKRGLLELETQLKQRDSFMNSEQ